MQDERNAASGDQGMVTQDDRTLYHKLLSLGSVNLNRRRMGLPIVDGFELIAAHRQAALTACRAQVEGEIVAWLRSEPWLYDHVVCSELADAITSHEHRSADNGC